MTLVNLIRVHARIAWRQKALWYTSIPLTLLAIIVSFGGNAPNTGDVKDLVYKAQVTVMFLGIAYAAAFTNLLTAPARLGIGELELSAPVGSMKLRMARVVGPFTVVIVPPLTFLLVMGTIQTVQGKWDGLPMALVVTASVIAPAMLCSIAISAFTGSFLPQAFARIVAVLVWFYLVFSTPMIPVPAPAGTIFGITGDVVAEGYFGSRPLYALTGPLSSSPGPATATVSLLWQLTLIIVLLAIGSRLSERFRDR